MIIAIDCRLIGHSGIGTYIENIVSVITQNKDIDFVLIGSNESLKSYATRDNCTIIDCSYPSFSIKELCCFPTKDVNRCDAFFTPNFNIPLGIHIPIFSMVHDVVFLDIKNLNSFLGRMIRYIYIWRATRISTAVITVSNFSKNRILSHFHTKIPIYVVGSGLSKKILNFRSQYTKVNKENYIIYLGNLKKHKGIEILIRAFLKAKKEKGIKLKLKIVGRINFRVKDKYVLELLTKVGQDIELVTNADDNTVYKLLQSARALVSPSFYEGFGLSPLESMALGTPAIISDIPAHKEVYRDMPVTFFKCGDVDDLSDKLANLTESTVDIERFLNPRFSFSQRAQEILNIIKTHIKPSNLHIN
ncbi:MAG: glycosyltransferase family 4 protein [Prevotella sp.]|jgi:glycosyltransferase involved in cell wall biosynthesis